MNIMKKPLKWQDASIGELRGIRGVCLDIDETLSTRGKLTADAYASLWELKNAGFGVVPVTGRPAGWCDHFARFWPVDAVVGENGAFVFYMQGGIRRRLDTPGCGADDKRRLEQLSAVIAERFGQVSWASDQKYREFDLAVDVYEDVKPWPRADVDALLELCVNAGAHAKLSSVHVNVWFGDYNKRKGLDHWLASGAPGWGAGKAPAPDDLLFIGDSPNDEPMFESFKASVGVANLSDYLDRLQHPPRWITTSESGAGFAEMARKLVALKNKSM